MASVTAAGAVPRAAGRSSRRAVLQLAAGMAVTIGAIAFLAYQGLQNALVFYITPSELMQKGHADIGVQLRLGGLVCPHSKQFDAQTHVVRFRLCDPGGSVAVVSSTVPPPMLRNGIGAVVQGSYNGRVFRATTIMVKHDGDYQAPPPGRLPANGSGYAHK